MTSSAIQRPANTGRTIGRRTSDLAHHAAEEPTLDVLAALRYSLQGDPCHLDAPQVYDGST